MPAVVFTGHGDRTPAGQAMECGALDYLAKRDATAWTLHVTVRNAMVKTALRRKIEIQRRELQSLNQVLQQNNTQIQQLRTMVTLDLTRQ